MSSDNSQNAFAFGQRTFNDEDRKRIESILRKPLAPEYLQTRAGPGNSRLTYIEGHKVISLAQEIFGFDGWSHSIVSSTIDYMDSVREGTAYNVGVSTIVRVTLKDGTSHEDIGYGSIENAKSKGQALEKAKKESVTDGIKRALKSFGNALGNCMYDKRIINNISKLPKATPIPFTADMIYRGSEFDSKKWGAQADSKVKMEEFSDDFDSMIFPGDIEALDATLLSHSFGGTKNPTQVSNISGNAPTPNTLPKPQNPTYSRQVIPQIQNYAGGNSAPCPSHIAVKPTGSARVGLEAPNEHIRQDNFGVKGKMPNPEGYSHLIVSNNIFAATDQQGIGMMDEQGKYDHARQSMRNAQTSTKNTSVSFPQQSLPRHQILDSEQHSLKRTLPGLSPKYSFPESSSVGKPATTNTIGVSVSSMSTNPLSSNYQYTNCEVISKKPKSTS